MSSSCSSYYSYFTNRDTLEYERKWGLYINDLVDYLKLYFDNATRKNLCRTRMTGPFSRIAPAKAIIFRGTVAQAANEDSKMLALELCELLALTQQTQYIFTWLSSSPRTSMLKLDAMLHIWHRRLPHSHQIFYHEMYKLFRSMDWRLAISQLQRLCRRSPNEYHLVECCEAVISQLLHDNAHALTTCFTHVAFYRHVFENASLAMQQLLTHNFGRPVELSDDIMLPFAAKKVFGMQSSTLSSLSSLAFDTLYHYYEYRLYLNVWHPALIHQPLQATPLLRKMTAPSYRYQVRLINLLGAKVSADIPYLTDKSIPTIQKMVVAGDWLYDTAPPCPTAGYIKHLHCLGVNQNVSTSTSESTSKSDALSLDK